MKKDPNILDIRSTPDAKTAFVFSGGGTQRKKMGLILMRKNEFFRRKMEECDALAGQYCGYSVIEEISRPADSSRIDDPVIGNPCILSIQVSLAHLLIELGIRPDLLLGHSLGEIAAAHIGGMLSLEDAFKVVATQIAVSGKTKNKALMIHVSVSHEKIIPLLKQFDHRVQVAAVNSPDSVILVGQKEALDRILADYSAKNIFCKYISIIEPFHSVHIKPYSDFIVRSLDSLRLEAPAVPVYSPVRGKMAEPDDFGPGYWSRAWIEPCLFYQALREVIATGCDVFVEIAPEAVLQVYIEECLNEAGRNSYWIMKTMTRKTPEHELFLNNLAAWISAGRSLRLHALSPEDATALEARTALKPDSRPQKVNDPVVIPAQTYSRNILQNLVKEGIYSVSNREIVPPSDTDIGFIHMGLNSFMTLELKDYLTQKLGRFIPITVFFEYPTIDRLVEFLLSPAGGGPKTAKAGVPGTP
ncbi:MAG: acyltransferase domain-containing protein, partial [Desulfobacteraceae bacterium]